MALMDIVKKVIMGAASASLDIAGQAVLPGAWPILKAALAPVIDRAKEKLGIADITASSEEAGRIVSEIEKDRHLQEMLRSDLFERLDALAKTGQEMNAD